MYLHREKRGLAVKCKYVLSPSQLVYHVNSSWLEVIVLARGNLH